MDDPRIVKQFDKAYVCSSQQQKRSIDKLIFKNSIRVLGMFRGAQPNCGLRAHQAAGCHTYSHLQTVIVQRHLVAVIYFFLSEM